MRPSELWPQMQKGERPVMRAALTGAQSSLLCLRGGECGEGELALRLPADTDVQSIIRPWDGVIIEQLSAEVFPGQQMIRIAPAAGGPRDLYVYLADDIHDQLDGVSGNDDTVRLVLARLRVWSNFLRRGDRSVDSRTARGLFAELSALEQLIVPIVGWDRALGMWTGPAGSSQDVMTDHLALDVKATQVDDHLVMISSIEQLDPPGSRTVRLLQAQLSEGAGESLASLIARLEGAATVHGAGHMFAARLSQLGLTIAALDGMAEQPMQVHIWTLHRADHPGFPALRRSLLPDAVVSATYRIDLSRSTAPPAELTDLPELLGRSTTGEQP